MNNREIIDQVSEYPFQTSIQFQSTLDGGLRWVFGYLNIRHYILYILFSLVIHYEYYTSKCTQSKKPRIKNGRELFDQASEYPCQHTIQFQSTLEGCLRRVIGRYNIRHYYLPFS